MFKLEEEFAKVENEIESRSSSWSTDDQRTSKSRIQKVPAFLRDRRKFCDFYSPKLLSIGPIHHHDDKLKPGEQYKLMWTAMYLTRVHRQQSGGWNIRDEYPKIKDKIVEVIKQRYSKEVIEEYRDNNYDALAWMLFVDGCSILEFMHKASYMKPEALNIKIDQLILMQQDLLLLENQIPFELLKLLCKDTNELSKSMSNFLKLNHMVPESVIESQSVPICQQPICQKFTCQQPTHLLDYLRKILCDDLTDAQRMILCKETPSVEQTTIKIREGLKELKWPWNRNIEELKPEQNSKQNNKWPWNRNIEELKRAGIKVRAMEKYLKATNKCNIREIHFNTSLFYGKLYLPRFVVDDSTGTIFSNLIAYEMCPNFENDFTISSYVAFLHSLIYQPEDVMELRREGILHNYLGSDQEVASLFNTITTDLVPDPRMYDQVKMRMEKYYNNRLKIWIAEFSYTHSIPLLAILVLGLTIVQTYYSIHGPK